MPALFFIDSKVLHWFLLYVFFFDLFHSRVIEMQRSILFSFKVCVAVILFIILNGFDKLNLALTVVLFLWDVLRNSFVKILN